MQSQTKTVAVESLEDNPVPGKFYPKLKQLQWRAERITQYLAIMKSQTKTVTVESREDNPVPGIMLSQTKTVTVESREDNPVPGHNAIPN